ncbi:MAG TPA: YhcH/YjgK/YiaL family protein [Opitutus sp.]|nr:YhcH/YjgK/YiaL family protein [Opitutus sp.]
MALFGSIATVRAQMPGAEKLSAVFDYLAEVARPETAAGKRLRAATEGDTQRVELAGGAFALEQVYRTKVRADGFFESHRRLIDVQVVIDGEEWMEIVDIARGTVRRPYHEERDFIVYENGEPGAVLHVKGGQAAVFYPADVHMPGLCGTAGPTLVRKTVVKVPVGK